MQMPFNVYLPTKFLNSIAAKPDKDLLFMYICMYTQKFHACVFVVICIFLFRFEFPICK